METKEYVTEAMQKNGISQNEVASRIGMTKENLSGAIHGRRPMPAAAAIYLAELCGRSAREVWEAIKKHGARAAVVLMTCGSLFISVPQEASADQSVVSATTPEYKLSRFCGSGFKVAQESRIAL